MWRRMNLRHRIYAILSLLVFITLAGGVVMVWYTYRMEMLLSDIIDNDVAAFQAAEALEIALVNQKGFVSYYFLDGDPEWLKQLGEYRQIFKERLEKTYELARAPSQKEALRRIEKEYQFYIETKDRVIDHYKAGEMAAGRELHQDVREKFFEILELSEAFKKINLARIAEAKTQSQARARKLRITAVAAMFTDFWLGVFLAVMLITQILGPVRKLTMEAERTPEPPPTKDEIAALSQTVRGLIQDVDLTHMQLEKSRDHLLQSEKMAMVGKLAAGTAHSIRNPLTSVKMRLFSLTRSLELTDVQKEDFDVISQEIRHIDHIVQNFLEFSRPPRLKMQQISPSVIVDMAIQLLAHRLKSYDVTVNVERRRPLPDVMADPEQFKEVLVNLMVNACEAMGGHGVITIRETENAKAAPPAVRIRISDTGPGVSEDAAENIFQPFFTTKEEGTGLGLSIVSRIIDEHNGAISVESVEGRGATFIITLPIMR